MADSNTAADRPFADAVVVAAGGSTRMAGIDKLAEPLLGRTLLEWSVAAMAAAGSVDRIVVVARLVDVERLRSEAWLAAASDGRASVVAGGERRSDSVRNGVAATAAEVVLIHDAARPLATPALADAVATAARQGAAVPVVPVVDSLKRIDGSVIDGSVERTGVVRTQTPQGARRELLVDALAAAGSTSFTDEAALLESRGVAVTTVPGEASNIKVTEPDDLAIVRAIAASRAADGAGTAGAVRFGLGQDTHGFGPADGLWLGGILLEQAPRLYGHSDGDVVLHAVATAVLAAAGLGDLGRLFPPSDPATEGIASAAMLAEAVRRAAESGSTIESAQVSLIGARPRLGARRIDLMRDRLAELLAVAPSSVSISASTGNLTGPEGAGRVISATALVGVHRR